MWSALESVGRDPRTGGYRRFAWTREDTTCASGSPARRRRVASTSCTDRTGNQWAWWGDPDARWPPADRGRHRLAPRLGARRRGLRRPARRGVAPSRRSTCCARAGFRPARPIGVVNFADEEGARFGVACAGSRAHHRGAGRRPGAGAARRRRRDAWPRRWQRPAATRRTSAATRDAAPGRHLRRAARRAGPRPGRPRPRRRRRQRHLAARPLAGRLARRGQPRRHHPPRRPPRRHARRWPAVLAARAAAAGAGLRGHRRQGRTSSPDGVNAIPRASPAGSTPAAPTTAAVRRSSPSVARRRPARRRVTEESWTADDGVRPRAGRATCAAVLGGVPVLGTGAGHDAGILANAGVCRRPCSSCATRPGCRTRRPSAPSADDCLAGVDGPRRAWSPSWPDERCMTTVLAPSTRWLPRCRRATSRVEAVDGRFARRDRPEQPAQRDDARLPGVVLPGLANAHSHAFHRALRGRTHDDGGNFWTWREQMYAVPHGWTPTRYLALARAVFAEMVLAGITVRGGVPLPAPRRRAARLRRPERDGQGAASGGRARPASGSRCSTPATSPAG